MLTAVKAIAAGTDVSRVMKRMNQTGEFVESGREDFLRQLGSQIPGGGGSNPRPSAVSNA